MSFRGTFSIHSEGNGSRCNGICFISLICSSFSSVPFITRKKKVPKVKMLRLAIKYIQHLESILNGGYVVSEGIHGVRSITSIGYSFIPIQKPSPICPPRPLKLEDFERVAVEEFNERNTYSNVSGSSSSIGDTKGGSGRKYRRGSASGIVCKPYPSGLTSCKFTLRQCPCRVTSGRNTVGSELQLHNGRGRCLIISCTFSVSMRTVNTTL